MLKAGFARTDITPPLGTAIAGYFGKRYAKGVLDPLYINAVALTSGEETVILVALDVLGIYDTVADRMRAMISERTGVPTDHIMVAGLHQHTSFVLHPDRECMLENDLGFYGVLLRKVADAAVMAMSDRREAHLSMGERELPEPLSFVRRYFGEDGNVYTNPPADVKVVAHCDEADNTVRLLHLRREGVPDIAILNFSTHPDVIGGELLSADWPGLSRTYLEEKVGNIRTLFLTGTQGDSNHINYLKPPAERFPHGARYEHAKHMASVISDTAVAILGEAAPSASEELGAACRVIYNRVNLDGIENYEKSCAFMADYEAGKLGNRHITELAYHRRIMSLRTGAAVRPIAVSAYRIGDAVLACFGGEAFTAYSRAARSLAPSSFVLTAVCANGYTGYFPTAKAFAEGGYEATSSPFTPDIEKQIVDALADAISCL